MQTEERGREEKCIESACARIAVSLRDACSRLGSGHDSVCLALEAAESAGLDSDTRIGARASDLLEEAELDAVRPTRPNC